MSDTVWQLIAIGGDPGEHREKIFELINDSFGDFEEDGEHLVINEDMQMGDEATEALKAFLREHGLSYDHHYEAKYDHEGEVWFWRPGMEEEKWSWALQDRQETVTVNDLQKMADEGLTLQQVIEKCRVPELPVWVMDPAVLELAEAIGECADAITVPSQPES